MPGHCSVKNIKKCYNRAKSSGIIIAIAGLSTLWLKHHINKSEF